MVFAPFRENSLEPETLGEGVGAYERLIGAMSEHGFIVGSRDL